MKINQLFWGEEEAEGVDSALTTICLYLLYDFLHYL